MERSRESKRAVSAPRRLRISCPKDPADAEARMDETPLIEKVKKGNLQALPPSFSATPTAWNKRKRNGFQEAHNLLEGGNFGKNPSESTPGEEHDDEALQGAVNSKQRAKKDELVMNICNIPRRARSSATRVPIAASRQPVTSQERSPSPRILATKEEKLRLAGMKSRLLKDLAVTESAQISDQEVEVAEALFDLSRSMASLVQSTSIACKEKSRRGLEEEEFNSSSSQIAGIENLRKSSCPFSEQKSKRQRVLHKQERTSCMPSAERLIANRGCGVSGLPLSVMEGIQVDKLECKLGNAGKLSYEQPDLMTTGILKEPVHGYSQFHVADGKNTNSVEERVHECKDLEENQNHFSEQISNQDLSARSKQELWCSPSKVLSEEEIKEDYRKLFLSESSLSPSKNCNGEVLYANNESVNQEKVKGVPIKDESRSGTEDVQRWNPELSKATISPMKEESNDLRLSDVKKEETVVPDLCKGQETFSAGGSLPSTVHPSSSIATTSMGWMCALPQLGVNRKAGPPRLTNSHLRSTSYQQVVQLPHASSARCSSQRIRHCATHVYIAHFIQQQQQSLSLPFWPPATNSYNRSSLPASLQGKDHWSNRAPSLQAAREQTSADNIGSRMPNSRGYSNSAHVLSVGAGTKRGVDDTKSVMSPAQIKQHTMQLNLSAGTVRMSLNGSPAQTASMLHKSLYSTHENLAQQANMSHFPKGQQGHHASLHVSLSHSYSTQPQAQLNHHVRAEQLKQQRSHLTTPPQLYGGAFLEGNRLGFR